MKINDDTSDGFGVLFDYGGDTYNLKISQRAIVELERRYDICATIDLNRPKLEWLNFLAWFEGARRGVHSEENFEKFLDDADAMFPSELPERHDGDEGDEGPLDDDGGTETDAR